MAVVLFFRLLDGKPAVEFYGIRNVNFSPWIGAPFLSQQSDYKAIKRQVVILEFFSVIYSCFLWHKTCWFAYWIHFKIRIFHGKLIFSMWWEWIIYNTNSQNKYEFFCVLLISSKWELYPRAAGKLQRIWRQIDPVSPNRAFFANKNLESVYLIYNFVV